MLPLAIAFILGAIVGAVLAVAGVVVGYLYALAVAAAPEDR